MTAHVRFVGSLQGLTGKHRLSVSIESPITLREMLGKIVEKNPGLRQVLAEPDFDGLATRMLVLVNRKEISVLNGLETTIKDGDDVVLVPVVHGG